MKKFEQKFLVINKKRFAEMIKLDPIGGVEVRNNFLRALEIVSIKYREITGKIMNQKYIAINQDEPYSKDVLNLILKEEGDK